VGGGGEFFPFWGGGGAGGGGGFGVFKPPPPEIPKALQNRYKLNPIVKTVKKIAEFRTPTPQNVLKKAVNF